MSYGFIYLSFDRKNEKFYIGKRAGRPDYGHNKKYFGSGTIVRNAVKARPGDFSRVIVELTNDEAHAKEREQYWLDFFDAVNDPDFYNLCGRSDGGKPKGFGKGRKQTAEHKEKRFASLRGRKRSPEEIEAMRGPRGPRLAGRNKYILIDPEGNRLEFFGKQQVFDGTGLSSRYFDKVMSGEIVLGWKKHVD